MYSGIKEGGKCKLGGKTCLFYNPILQRTVWSSREKVSLNPLSGAQWHTMSEVERQAGGHTVVGKESAAILA